MSFWWWFCQWSEIVGDDNGWSNDDYNGADYDAVKLPLPYYHQDKEEGFDNDEGRENDDLVNGKNAAVGQLWVCGKCQRPPQRVNYLNMRHNNTAAC